MLIDKISELGIPAYMGVYPANAALPYIALSRAAEDRTGSDDGVASVRKTTWTLDLYTAEPDFELEERLEDIIYPYDWKADPDNYLQDENCYRKSYSLNIFTK
ncbi:MAG: hypothetical protein ACI4EA_03660 [Candidatus Ornithomonoglobus sp.]